MNTANTDTVVNVNVVATEVSADDASTSMINLNAEPKTRRVRKGAKADASKSKSKAKAKAKAKSGPGRPAKSVVIPTEGAFTLKQLKEANPTVNAVTIRAHVLRGIERGTYSRLPDVVRSGRKGKPAHRFITAKGLARRNKRQTNKATSAVVEAAEAVMA